MYIYIHIVYIIYFLKYLHACVYVCVFVCMCVCTYKYIYIYILWRDEQTTDTVVMASGLGEAFIQQK